MMHKTIFILFIFYLISCVPQKKEKIQQDFLPKTSAKGITQISFDEEMHNFETIISGEIVVATFAFTNTGEHNLIIDKIESDCGCIRVNFSKEPVKPGNTGIIEVEFNSSGLFGKQFKSIEIHSNTKELKHLAIFASVKNEELEIIY